MASARGKKHEATPLQGVATGVGQASKGRGKGQTTAKETKPRQQSKKTRLKNTLPDFSCPCSAYAARDARQCQAGSEGRQAEDHFLAEEAKFSSCGPLNRATRRSLETVPVACCWPSCERKGTNGLSNSRMLLGNTRKMRSTRRMDS